MKNLALLLLLVITGSAVAQSSSTYSVTGKIDGLGNASLLILKFIDDGVQFDSVIAKDDTFYFSGEIHEPYFVQILIKNGKTTSGKLTEFMLEDSEISIKGTEPIYEKVKVEGSKSDEVLKSYFEDDEVLTSKWDSLKIHYDQAVQENDSTQRKFYAKKLNYITKVERVDLLRTYVKNNSTSTVGALLPIFCTIEDNLSKEDYKDFYNMLSPQAKDSGYGEVILQRSKGE